MRRPRFSRLLRSFRRLVRRVVPVPQKRARAWTAAPRAQPARTPALPPEVWERILTNLWDDRHALAACALTCRAFLPVVRRLVFRAVRVAHTPARADYPPFVHLLHESPHVALSVRELAVTIDPEAARTELPAILPRLHEVERLTLNFAGGMFEMTDDTRDKLTTYFHSVKRLRLENVRFDGTDLLQILCACPRLAELSLLAVRWRRSSLLPTYTSDLAAIVPPETVVLDELILRSPPPQVVAWLVKGPFQLNLRKLELIWDGSADAKYVPSLFKAAGASLRDLTIAFPGWFSFSEAMNLSQNTRLSGLFLDKIRIDGAQPRYLYVPDPVQLRTYEWVPAALAHVHSLHLQQVHFSVELCNGGDLDVLDWARIDDILARLARAAGQLITTFHVLNTDYAPAKCDIVDAVMYRLPRLREALGRLGVVYRHVSSARVEEGWFP
ncbi:hypothetical protein WOLCODRAFT_138312 [Wolfiporia cocos MD-104 SS10]|uniref:F-box/LRR-repeat protein 15/At3g58940/PEG3-like LRR domain-containing protein n=1 Tax=Wolfiporia cocos (strain MD-104) TaxID=742152 RepID=A0A2H3JMH5_WOLCO|nr:hypothetical protein WOLCODRAFT_138312 [Wolfiporia cocos MD-104 SS10]